MHSFAQFVLTLVAVGSFAQTQIADLGPATFIVNSATPGGGGATFKDSARFRIYNATSEPAAETALKLLEAACMWDLIEFLGSS
jgi:hypothetical protein